MRKFGPKIRTRVSQISGSLRSGFRFRASPTLRRVARKRARYILRGVAAGGRGLEPGASKAWSRYSTSRAEVSGRRRPSKPPRRSWPSTALAGLRARSRYGDAPRPGLGERHRQTGGTIGRGRPRGCRSWGTLESGCRGTRGRPFASHRLPGVVAEPAPGIYAAIDAAELSVATQFWWWAQSAGSVSRSSNSLLRRARWWSRPRSTRRGRHWSPSSEPGWSTAPTAIWPHRSDRPIHVPAGADDRSLRHVRCRHSANADRHIEG